MTATVTLSVRYAPWRPGRVLAASLGFGAGYGAAVGLLVVLIPVFVLSSLNGQLNGLGALLFIGPYACAIGALVGVACGLVACAAMLLAGGSVRAADGPWSARPRVQVNTKRAATAAGGGAALAPLAAAAWALLEHSAGWAAAFAGVAAVALAFGLLLGPRVLYGRAAASPRRAAQPCRDAGSAR